MSSSSDPVTLLDQLGLPRDLSAEDAGLYVDGLTQTCAALRRRISELEADNRSLRKRTNNNSSSSSIESGGIPGGMSKQGPPVASAAAEAQLAADAAMMTILSPSATVTGERRGAAEVRRGRGFKRTGRDSSSPRTRLSWVGQGVSDDSRRRSTLLQQQQQQEDSSAVLTAMARMPTPDDNATRRVSSVPRRPRYSLGVSRFSLPSNLSPGRSTAAASTVGADGIDIDGGCGGEATGPEGDGAWRREAGGLWEGLSLSLLTHPLTGDERNLTFMEFAVVGVAPSTLAGFHPLQPWGQDPEVLAGFPAVEGGAEGILGRGKGDGSFVQGLGDFCFPCGANLVLVDGAEGTTEAVPDDRVHLVQFTDCENASTYGCCLTVTQVLQNPSPRLVKRLQDRKRMHSAATRLQRFMQTAIASSPSGSRRRWRKGGGVSGYGSPYRPTTPLPAEGEATGKPSRFGFQTPPPGSGNKSGDTAASHADDFAAAASELSPTSFSGMINRLFSSQSGVTDGGDITALAGGSPAAGDGDGSVDGAAMPTAPIAAAREAAPVGASLSSRSPPRTRPRAPASPLRRRPPSSPCPATNPSQIGGTSGGKGRARSAGYSGGGSSVRDLGCDTSNINKFGRSGGAREEHIPGMFSDDESESDAGCSPDRDGPVIAAAAAEATDSLPVTHSNSSHSGSNFDSRGGAKGRHPTNVDQWSDGRDSLGLDFGQGLNGAPVLREGRAEEPGTPTTPPGVTMRTRVAKPRVVAAAAAAATAVPREESPRWSVLVEKCYVMVSCHRNHPLMFKVLKTIADAERSSGHGSSGSSSTLSPPYRASRGTRRSGLSSSLSPARTRTGRGSGRVGGRGSTNDEVDGGYDDGDGDGKKEQQLPRSASTFRSVAAAAAEEAKWRHRRMLRDKFLLQIQTDKSCTEEGKKVSLQCPAYLRAPLEVTPTALELWSTAVLFGCVSEDVTLQALDVLLLEKTLVVCGRDLGMVSMAATALLSLLDPFEWEGVFVPVVPRALMDVLDSPVPALVGVQAPFDPLDYAFDGVVVLDLDARNGLGHVFMEGIDERPTVPEDVVASLKKANTFRGRARGSGSSMLQHRSGGVLLVTAKGETGRSPRRSRDVPGGHSRKGPTSPTRAASSYDGGGGGGGGAANVFGTRFASASAASPLSLGRASSSLSPGPSRSHFAFQASTFMSGLTLEEKGTVLRLRSLVRRHVSALCGDLERGEMWRKYGAFNSVTKNFDFHPDWFIEPLEARLRFQVAVARTQMFVSFVDRCRQKGTKQITGDDESLKGEGRQHTPDKKKQRHPPRTGKSGSADMDGSGKGNKGGSSPPPLPARGL